MAISKKVKETEAKLKLYKSMEKGNQRFRAMSSNKKKVAIAKDVLLQLSIKKYWADPGNYLGVETDVNYNEDPQACLADKSTTCSVCAIGALFISKVRIGNQFGGSIQEAIDGNKMVRHLRGIFSENELRYMEFAFEGNVQGGASFNEKESEKAIAFCDKYNDSTKRLKAIMENIIKNKGKFVL